MGKVRVIIFFFGGQQQVWVLCVTKARVLCVLIRGSLSSGALYLSSLLPLAFRRRLISLVLLFASLPAVIVFRQFFPTLLNCVTWVCQRDLGIINTNTIAMLMASGPSDGFAHTSLGNVSVAGSRDHCGPSGDY